MKGVKLCLHTKRNGQLCGAIAMKRSGYCHYHIEQRRRQMQLARGMNRYDGEQLYPGWKGEPFRRWLKFFISQRLDA